MARMARYTRPVQDVKGNLLSEVWCRVRREDVPNNPLVPIYSDREGSVQLPNPAFFPSGIAMFHAVGGSYMVEVWTAGGFSETYRYQAIGRGAETDIEGLNPRGEHDMGISYDRGDLVTVLDAGRYLLFASTMDDNLGNAPDSATPGDTTEWQFAGYAAQMVSTGIFVALSGEQAPVIALPNAVRMRNFGVMKIMAVRASLSEASVAGPVQVDINVNGVSILSTKLTIDQGEKTSLTALVPAVISDDTIDDDSEISFDVDDAGSSAVGLKVTIASKVQ